MPSAAQQPNGSGAACAADAAPDDDGEQDEHRSHAPTKPSSSPMMREDEVGVRLGQEEELLPALAEPQRRTTRPRRSAISDSTAW